MLPGLEMMACADLAVPAEVMQHVVKVESSFNPYAIGVVGGRLARQPRSLGEAVSTARMLEREGYNFSLGIAQVNRYNLGKQRLTSYEHAFDVCPNLQAGARILAECYGRSGQDWGKAFSCYYSGNFTTGFRHGYVQKVLASWRGGAASSLASAIPVIRAQSATIPAAPPAQPAPDQAAALVLRRIEEAALSRMGAKPSYTAAVDAAPAGKVHVNSAPISSTVIQAHPTTVVPPDAAIAAPGAVSDADAPVIVRAMGATAPLPVPAAASGARQAPPAGAVPQNDAAFVF